MRFKPMRFKRSLQTDVAVAAMPHCDQRVLHAPNICDYCDKYPEWQEYRKIAMINFTGENDSSKAPCPSHYFRALEDINRWAGNVPADGSPEKDV